VRVDLVLPNEGPHALEAMRAAARFEEMGYGGLWLTDHVIGLEAYQPVYGDYWLEMLTAMGFLAASTKKIRLGTGVLVVPMRDPVLTAKMLATIDVLSGGRLDLGIGTGWSRREFQSVGRGDVFEDRGRYTDQALEVFLECWKGGELAFDRGISRVSKVRFEPIPVQKPHPPIWVGARGLAAAPMRRAAKYADVWHPASVSPEDIVRGGDELDARAGRKIKRSVRFYTTKVEIARDLVAKYDEIGCFQVAVDFKVREFAEFARLAEALAKDLSLG
jgi:probable F420-dependent oxidoreductase